MSFIKLAQSQTNQKNQRSHYFLWNIINNSGMHKKGIENLFSFIDDIFPPFGDMELDQKSVIGWKPCKLKRYFWFEYDLFVI